MVDFVILKANKPTAAPLYIAVRLAAKSKIQFFSRKSSPKITLFVVDFLGRRLISKSKVCF